MEQAYAPVEFSSLLKLETVPSFTPVDFSKLPLPQKAKAGQKSVISRRQFIKLGAAATGGAAAAFFLEPALQAAQTTFGPQAKTTPVLSEIAIPSSDTVQSQPSPQPEVAKPAQPTSEAEKPAPEIKQIAEVEKKPKPLMAEARMPDVRFQYQLNKIPEAIPFEAVPNPPDLGTAYLLALWGHPHWQEVFFNAYNRDDLQTSTRFKEDGISFWDYNYLGQQWFPDYQYIVTKDPSTNETKIKSVVFEKAIRLPNGETISGVKVFDHQAKGVGLLEKLWLTTAPEEFNLEMLGIKQLKFLPELLADAAEKIYIVVDDKEVYSYNTKDLFSQTNPLTGRVENGGFIFNPLLTYKNAQVYLSPPNIENEKRKRTTLWYKVVGQDFDPSVLENVPAQKASPEKRSKFLSWFYQKKDAVLNENFPIKERVFVKDTWSTTIEDEGYSQLTFRVGNPSDLNNVILNIAYPQEENLPPISINLQNLIGLPRQDVSFANRYISIATDESGGVKIRLNETLPLPVGAKISILAKQNSQAEIFWQHRPQKIGNLRFGIFHQTLERDKSVNGRQTFNPIQKDFIVSELMFYIDDPAVDINTFNDLFARWDWIQRVDFNRGYLEGNFYIVQADGKIRPIAPGLEDLGDGGFYCGPFLKPYGDTSKMCWFGDGEYANNFVNSSNPAEAKKLFRVDYKNKEKMFGLAYGNTLMKLEKGDRFMIMPGAGPYETARVAATLFGHYKV